MKIFIDAIKEKYNLKRFEIFDISGYEQGYDEEKDCYWARCEAVIDDGKNQYVAEHVYGSKINIKFIDDENCEIRFTTLADMKTYGSCNLKINIDPEYVYDVIDICWN